MSEGRIENLAALMAAIVVVLKTGDLPQKMKPRQGAAEPKYPYGIFQFVAKDLGYTTAHVTKVAKGLRKSAVVEKALAAALRTFAVRGRPAEEHRILHAVALECNQTVERVLWIATGTRRSAPIRASLVRHGWPHPITSVIRELPCSVEDRKLIKRAEIAQRLGVSQSLVSLVIRGEGVSAKVFAAIVEAVAVAKQKQAGQ